MHYDIIIKPSAEKSFAKLPSIQQRKIFSAIELLATNPRPSGVKKLKNRVQSYIEFE
ncbi:MAG: hypothetical protein PHQ03_03565 [Methylococcales bacterium]|nr:hypothetical protein [Methylococcales bacterium]